MKIAYRRMSGAIGVSDLEQGSRGLWWEKRRSFVRLLKSRGHEVDYVNRMTRYSNRGPTLKISDKHELLIVEFGSSNTQFYGEDLTETCDMVQSFTGKIVFICDDPDLPFLWGNVHPLTYRRWSAWYNCIQPKPFGKQPEEIKCYDFPFSSYQRLREPRHEYGTDLVYIGRPKGRETWIKAFNHSGVRWKVYSKEGDWKAFPSIPIFPPPTQPSRSEFYNRQLGSITLADGKHKELKWRTGRAYHAVMAGCPALVEQSHGLPGFDTFNTAEEVVYFSNLWKVREHRWKSWERASFSILQDLKIGLSTLEAHGL